MYVGRENCTYVDRLEPAGLCCRATAPGAHLWEHSPQAAKGWRGQGHAEARRGWRASGLDSIWLSASSAPSRS